LRYLLDHSKEIIGGALTNEQKIKIFLCYVSDPGFQSGIAEALGVSDNCVKGHCRYCYKNSRKGSL
jgi:hypothetical protein